MTKGLNRSFLINLFRKLLFGAQHIVSKACNNQFNVMKGIDLTFFRIKLF